MGTVLTFPVRRKQRLSAAETKSAAQIIIFPGVRIERSAAGVRPVVSLSGGDALRQRLPDEREH